MTTLERIFRLADKKFPEQQDFAQALGVKPSIVSQWKNGITKSYERRLHQIADVLDTTVEYLVNGDEKKPAAEDGNGPVVYDKLAKTLLDQGIDVGTLSDAQLQRLAKIIAAALEQ